MYAVQINSVGVRLAELLQLGQRGVQVAVGTQPHGQRHALRGRETDRLEPPPGTRPPTTERRLRYGHGTCGGTSLSTASLCRAETRTSCSCFFTSSLLQHRCRVVPTHRYRKLWREQRACYSRCGWRLLSLLVGSPHRAREPLRGRSHRQKPEERPAGATGANMLKPNVT
ncbi:hypothetical protein EYF80_054362 [Liparis tanakae]|uniref:Uncharacterized protein n=1 Tax=Liparis tanakae TaxID=230148 RepID=A0A4Z2F2U9_9TELE|nr:hypothetical protein EYF80_054362 [Liparis tanakae]